MSAANFLLTFVIFLYCSFLVLPFLVLGVLSLVRYFRYRDQWNGEGRARQCRRDAIIFFAIAAVSLGVLAYITWGEWMPALYRYF